MKKRIFVFLLILINFFSFSQNVQFDEKKFGESVLENGLELFTLEDFSDASVKVQFVVRSGISFQNQENTGFFTLYTQILEELFKNSFILKDLKAECLADSTKFSFEVSPFYLKNALLEFSKTIFEKNFPDKIISRQISDLKMKVMQYSQSPEGFINSSIDSRVFSSAPWKHDSGIYPSLFKNLTISEARKELNKIHDNFYFPENCAIFLSGAISKNDSAKIVESVFSSFKKQNKKFTDFVFPVKDVQKKFVLHDANLSEDLTQIIIQYKNLGRTESDIFSCAYNFKNSQFKMGVLSKKDLKIPGDEYINVESTHKNGISRVIFQTLMENSNLSPVEQTESFLDSVKSEKNFEDENAFLYAKQILADNFQKITKDSANFMEYLAQFWALKEKSQDSEGNFLNLLDSFLSEQEKIENCTVQKIKTDFFAEEPFVFVLVNSKTYKKFKNQFKKSGYSEINAKNSSWYTNELYKNAKNLLKTEKDFKIEKTQTDFFNEFYQKNMNEISSFTLKNKIPVFFKKNDFSETAVFLLGIKCGKFSDFGKNGLSSVVVKIFSQNIQNEILKSQKIELSPQIETEIFDTFSIISVECKKNDIFEIENCIFRTLIEGEIFPYQADGIVYSLQTEKRLYNASPVNQMKSRAINIFYSDRNYKNAFDSKNDILENVEFNEILDAYTKFLDSSLFNIVVSGNFDDEKMKNSIKSDFETLYFQGGKFFKSDFAPILPSMPKKSVQNVKLEHYFYTDIKAEDAPPMPSVLVPTKNFYDPVQFYLKSPDFESDDFEIFNALAQFLQNRLETSFKDSEIFKNVLVQPATKNLQVLSFTFLNVSEKKKIKELYQNAIQKLKTDLENPDECEKVVEQIKNSWILENLKKTSTNYGTDLLLNSGYHEQKNEKAYLENYKKVFFTTAQKFLQVLQDFFVSKIDLELYSAD